jgi:hypothetical protein
VSALVRKQWANKGFLTRAKIQKVGGEKQLMAYRFLLQSGEQSAAHRTPAFEFGGACLMLYLLTRSIFGCFVRSSKLRPQCCDLLVQGLSIV